MSDYINQLNEIHREVLETISASKDIQALEALKSSILGKRGSISKILGSLKNLNVIERPSVEVDVLWKNKWLEVMGCGMVDLGVMQNLNLDTKNWSGFAMGLGVERFCMVRHNIDDIRRLYTSDLRFLKQF